MKSHMWGKFIENRRAFIGGSDVRIIMGNEEAALISLWHEKRGEAQPEGLVHRRLSEFALSAETQTALLQVLMLILQATAPSR
jgi:hypothetical protein